MKLSSILLTSLYFFSVCAETNPNLPPPRRITFRHIESGGVGYDNGYTTIEAFISADPNSWAVTPFLDGRGHVFDDGTWAANGGVGLRGEMGKRIYGINAYYDYRGTKHLHYNQASVGLETLGAFIDARINGYLPFGRKMSSPYDTEFGYFSGHSLFLSQKVEFAMKGLDAEVGFHFGNCDSWNFQANAGPYYFHGYKGPNAWGGKIRASASYQDRVTFEVIESYDNVFHNKFQGQIAFSIPLGRKTDEVRREQMYCRRIQPVARNEIVVISHKHRYPVAINPLTQSPFFFVFVDNTSSSEGTFESPYPSLLLAQDNSSPNQIIYTFPGDGTTSNMDQGITLQASQRFWGSGVAHHLQTEQGSITVPKLSATAPQVTNINLLGAGATLSTHNEISGITFIETSGHAISGTNPIEFNLSACTFIACGQGDLGLYPVFLQASTPLSTTIVDNIFTENTDGGVIIDLLTGASSTKVTITNNQAYHNFANSGAVGLFNIEALNPVGTCELTVSNNILQNNECGLCNITDFNSPHDGSYESFEGTFIENTCTGSTQSQAIFFGTNATNCTLNIHDNDLSNNSHGSVYVQAGSDGTQKINNAIIVIDSNQLNNGGNAGDSININPYSDNLSITITNNSINNNLGSGYSSFLQQPSMTPGPITTLYIANNVISNNQNMQSNASGGISMDGFQSISAIIENNTLSNNAQGNSIGKNGSSFLAPDTSTVTFTNNQLSEGDTFEFDFYGDAPETGCLTITGNTSTLAMDPTYIFTKASTGDCLIVPCDYATENTGEFSAMDAIPSQNCSGTPCP